MYSVNPSYYCFMSCHTCLLYPTLPFVILPQTYLLLFLPLPLPIVSMQLHGILCFSISLLPVEVSVYLSYIRLFNSFLCFLAPVCLLIHKWIQLVFGAILLFDPPGQYKCSLRSSTNLVKMSEVISIVGDSNVNHHLDQAKAAIQQLILDFAYSDHQRAPVLFFFSHS